MKLIVTGGAGFIGSAVIRHLINATDAEVVNIDKLTYAGNLESLKEISSSRRYVLEQVDICDRKELDRIFDCHNPDAVMHLAAESHVDRSIDGPADFIRTNIVGTYTLLEASRAYWHGLDCSSKSAFRFHHVSTDEVFGDLGDTNRRFSETTAYAPNSPYSATKAGSDHLVNAWNRTYGLPTIITSCSNNYGPRQYPEKLIPLVILNALEGSTLPVYGKGDQVRDWVYVEDHACALCNVLSHGSVGERYSIGGNNELKNIDVVIAICDILDELRPIRDCSVEGVRMISSYRDLIGFVPDRPGHDRRYATDASKIQRDLGWHPIESFETGIRKTVSWYLENLEWCQKVQDRGYRRERLGAPRITR